MPLPVETRRFASLAAQPSTLESLRRTWAVSKPGDRLPWFEDVALGVLECRADQTATIASSDGGARIVRAGAAIARWLGEDGAGRRIADLRRDCAVPLRHIVDSALRDGEPAQTLAHVVTGGMVETHDVIALPLRSRWGPPVVLVCMQDRGEHYGVLETMFAATQEGMLALTTIRDATGRTIDYRIVCVNEGACRLLDRPQDALLWKCLSEIDVMRDYGVCDRLRQMPEGGERRHFEISYRVGATLRHLKIGVAPVRDLLAMTFTDIADVKARDASFRLLFDNNPVPMWLFDPVTLEILQVNDAAVAHYGYERAAFLALPALDVVHPDMREAARNALKVVEPGYNAEWFRRHVKADGSPIDVCLYLRSLNIDGRLVVLTAILDITERRRAEERVIHMAHHDALTGLPNRILFRERLEGALGGVRDGTGLLAVFCLDLDHFKSVNDTLGHPIGDKLLQAVAGRFQGCVREHDVVARLGGDEFAVIQSDGTLAQAGALADRLIDSLSAPYDIDGYEIVIGASIGIALAPRDGGEPDVLLKNADAALYQAKADGRRTYHFFEPDLDVRLRARRQLELDMRNALAAGQFELHYQPLVDARTATVSGFEALMRWRHPLRGIVSPAEFIPLAEETGLIVPLGEWALQSACAQAARWPGALKVAVNLSPVQFKCRTLVATVVGALAASCLDATRLELEITESILLRDSEKNLAILHQLKALGVRISMDDFGTGYSSLAYLRRFPFDKIKIDRSFVSELAQNPHDAAIVRAVTGLGASLGIAITAEGVETEAQFERLRSEGCTEVQGYLFSPPRPADKLGPLLTGRPMLPAAGAARTLKSA